MPVQQKGSRRRVLPTPIEQKALDGWDTVFIHGESETPMGDSSRTSWGAFSARLKPCPFKTSLGYQCDCPARYALPG